MGGLGYARCVEVQSVVWRISPALKFPRGLGRVWAWPRLRRALWLLHLRIHCADSGYHHGSTENCHGHPSHPILRHRPLPADYGGGQFHCSGPKSDGKHRMARSRYLVSKGGRGHDLPVGNLFYRNPFHWDMTFSG